MSKCVSRINLGAVSSLFKSLNETVNTSLMAYTDLAQCFTLPNSVFESLRVTMEQISKLAVPSKILIQSFAMFETPAIFSRLPELQTNWLINTPIIDKPTIKNEKEYNEQIINEEKLLNNEVNEIAVIEPQITEKTYYYYQPTKTFLIKQVGYAAITLYTKRETSGLAVFFETCLDFLNSFGQLTGDFLKVFIPIDDFQRKLKSKGLTNPGMSWIKSTKSNFLNYKVPPFLRDSIDMSEYDAKMGGFYFWVRVRTPIPKLS